MLSKKKWFKTFLLNLDDNWTFQRLNYFYFWLTIINFNPWFVFVKENQRKRLFNLHLTNIYVKVHEQLHVKVSGQQVHESCQIKRDNNVLVLKEIKLEEKM